MKRIYAEVRCDYYDAYDNFWTVDAWMSADENDEEGKVVAVINGTTGDVWYCDPDARLDSTVDELIKAKVKEIRNPLGAKATRLVTRNFLKPLGFKWSNLFSSNNDSAYRLKKRNDKFDYTFTAWFNGKNKLVKLKIERIEVETVKVKRSCLEFGDGITVRDFANLCSDFGINLLRD